MDSTKFWEALGGEYNGNLGSALKRNCSALEESLDEGCSNLLSHISNKFFLNDWAEDDLKDAENSLKQEELQKRMAACADTSGLGVNKERWIRPDL